jgi:hypothetical protein
MEPFMEPSGRKGASEEGNAGSFSLRLFPHYGRRRKSRARHRALVGRARDVHGR